MDHEDKKNIPRRQSVPRVKSEANLTKKQKEQIDDTIFESNIQYEQQVEQMRTDQQLLDLETIDTILSEHVGPFILIGFDLNNEPIEIFHANSALEACALSDHFKKVFVERTVRHNTELL